MFQDAVINVANTYDWAVGQNISGKDNHSFSEKHPRLVDGHVVELSITESNSTHFQIVSFSHIITKCCLEMMHNIPF